MSVISREYALEIARAFADEAAGRGALVAGFAVGSLGGDYYRPGQSDIDTLLIFDCTRAEATRLESELEPLAEEYQARYGVPKGFGVVVMAREQLFPPYIAQEELVLEIMRLKVQSRPVWGKFDVDSVPMPDRDAIIACENAFEDWRESEFHVAPESMTRPQAVNSIVLLLRRYLMLERGETEFNKFRIVAKCLESRLPFADEHHLSVISDYLSHGDAAIDADELLAMSKWHVELLKKMNEMLLGRN